MRIWGEGFQQRALCVFACLVAWVFGDVNKKLQPRKREKRYSVPAASRGHNNKMLIYSFSWLHFPCGCHFLGHSIWPGGMREAIRRPTAGGAACWTPNQSLGQISIKPKMLSFKILGLDLRITPSLSLSPGPRTFRRADSKSA